MRRCLRQKKNATAAKTTAAMPPTTPPTIGPVLELLEDVVVSFAEAVPEAEAEVVCVDDWEEELVVVPLLVVDAHFVNVLLFDAEKSVDIVSFVQVLQGA